MFDELQDELARRGVGLAKLSGPEFGHQQYWQPKAQVTLYVSLEDDPGTVQKMKALCAMTEDQRERWVGRKKPDDFRSWWRYCTRLTATRTAQDEVSDTAAFVEFVFWMWEFGREAYTPKETTRTS